MTPSSWYICEWATGRSVDIKHGSNPSIATRSSSCSTVMWKTPGKQSLPGSFLMWKTSGKQSLPGPFLMWKTPGKQSLPGLFLMWKTSGKQSLPGSFLMWKTSGKQSLPGSFLMWKTSGKQSLPGSFLMWKTPGKQSLPGPFLMWKTSGKQSLPGSFLLRGDLLTRLGYYLITTEKKETLTIQDKLIVHTDAERSNIGTYVSPPPVPFKRAGNKRLLFRMH